MSLKFEVNTYRPLSTLFLEDIKSVACNDEGIAVVVFESAESAKPHLVHWKSLGYGVNEIKADPFKKA